MRRGQASSFVNRADDVAEAGADAVGEGTHFGGFGGREMAFAVPIPEFEPGGEMLFLEAEGEMFERHLAGVVGRAAGRAGPEFGDFGDVFRPILNARVKDGADDLVLANVGIEMPQEGSKLFLAADAFE